jgi:glutamate-1-semialdehyde 2,1-aminomutase
VNSARIPGPRSRGLWARAVRRLSGGVSSPVRSFSAVGGTPVFFQRGRGAYLVDVDGRRYLDFVNTWGATILGHAAPTVVAAVRRAAQQGLAFGAPSPYEVALADRLRSAVPSLERLRFVNSGTEAVMSAVRLARGATGRSTIVKFAGGYHGHSDGLLARAGSGVATQALPDSAGVPPAVVSATRVLPYNDEEAVAALFDREGSEIAAVVVEPIAGNMGVVPPRPHFLETLSRRARDAGALVISDEVITGFRLRRGTVNERLGLSADLVTLGKVIGGGLPVAAYGGSRRLMDLVAPLGPVYQAGTLSGNPLGMAAGAAVLDRLTPAAYRRLESSSAEVEEELRAGAKSAGLEEFSIQRVGSMLGIFFVRGPVTDLSSAERTDRRRYARFFHAALRGRMYFPPSPLETSFVSMALQPSDLDRARPALRAAFRAARGKRP